METKNKNVAKGVKKKMLEGVSSPPRPQKNCCRGDPGKNKKYGSVAGDIFHNIPPQYLK